jgi:hypothetical protein
MFLLLIDVFFLFSFCLQNMIGDDRLILGVGGELTVFVNRYSGHPKLENNNSVLCSQVNKEKKSGLT